VVACVPRKGSPDTWDTYGHLKSWNGGETKSEKMVENTPKDALDHRKSGALTKAAHYRSGTLA